MQPDVLVDTSAAVALVVVGHEAHTSTLTALDELTLGLSGHAWFETFSVLTRLPGSARRSGRVVHEILRHDFPASRFLSAVGANALIEELQPTSVVGGAIYDALVAAAAREHRVPLVSRDRRAAAIYREVGVEIRWID
jgi:predicted nucleic acid-binding protein